MYSLWACILIGGPLTGLFSFFKGIYGVIPMRTGLSVYICISIVAAVAPPGASHRRPFYA